MTTPHPSFPATPLRRSRTDRQVAGVCAGVAASFGIDVTLVRVLVVLLAVFGHLAGLVLYLACWALVPQADVPGEAAGPATA
jgi:phage shock protein PspC (stress-responsive transcriptional regulator)